MSERLPVVKNQIVELEIRDLGTEGEGIGRYEDYTLFVPGVLPGEKVRVKVVKTKSHYGFGRLEEILEASPDREIPPCPVAGKCGGCHLQHLSYEQQLKFKEHHVRELLERVAGLENVPMAPVLGMTDWEGYRNKVQYPIREVEGRLTYGFYALRSHRLIEAEHCLLQSEKSTAVLKELMGWLRLQGLKAYDETTGKGLLRHVLIREGRHTGQMLVCLVLNGRKLPQAAALGAFLKDLGVTTFCLNFNTKNTNVILGPETETVMGPGYITDTIGSLSYRIAPVSFFQVNPEQTEKLYATALNFAGLTGGESVWDAYCGAGTISLFLAQKARHVYGVEVVPEAIRDARINATDNGIQNVSFYTGKAEEVIPDWYHEQGEPIDVMVVDPPRAGCDEKLLNTMLQMAPKRIVYVSCDPGTLARDLKKLCGEGSYRVVKVQPVDMFPQTVHVESVVLLTKVHNG